MATIDSTPKWVKDLRSRLDSIEYGQVQITVHKAANKVVKSSVPGYETLKPKSNQDAVKTILFLLSEIQDTEVTGDLSIVISHKKGNIELLAIQTNKVNYYE